MAHSMYLTVVNCERGGAAMSARAEEAFSGWMEAQVLKFEFGSGVWELLISSNALAAAATCTCTLQPAAVLATKMNWES